MNRNSPLIRRARDDFGWDQVDRLEYKAEGSAPFRDVSRQLLFADAGGAEWRYFEVAPGGWSTLERHRHTHAVMVLRGHGHCLLGDEVQPIGERDLIDIPPLTWHQFRAGTDVPLGFLCLVSRDRDRPELPDAAALDALRRTPAVAAFLDGDRLPHSDSA